MSIATESIGSISPAERIRLVHQHVTTSTKDGGLGVTPGAVEWPRVSSVFILHDHDYNDCLISSWKAELDISSHLDSIKDHVSFHFVNNQSIQSILATDPSNGLLPYLS